MLIFVTTYLSIEPSIIYTFFTVNFGLKCVVRLGVEVYF